MNLRDRMENVSRAPHFTIEDRSTLRGWVISFHNDWMRLHVVGPLSQALNVVPASLQSIINDLTELQRVLQGAEDLDPRFLPHLKRVVIWTRREKAASVEDRASLAHSVEVLDRLQDELAPFTHFMEQDWFRETEALTSPKLTDHLTVSHSETILRARGGLNYEVRTYDEKFQILLAPTLFLPDLAYFRVMCELREQSVSVAYVDIDEFKSFNDKYTHEKVDRDILPRFMSEMERHVFSRGSAYRIGGDEYLILLPNMSKDHAISFLRDFQNRLKNVNYFGVEKGQGPTVSLGMCEVRPDSELTDREVRDKADEAHVFAKKEGRDRIATFTDGGYEELEVTSS